MPELKVMPRICLSSSISHLYPYYQTPTILPYLVTARSFLDSLRRGFLSQETVLEAKRDARVRGEGENGRFQQIWKLAQKIATCESTNARAYLVIFSLKTNALCAFRFQFVFLLCVTVFTRKSVKQVGFECRQSDPELTLIFEGAAHLLCATVQCSTMQ